MEVPKIEIHSEETPGDQEMCHNTHRDFYKLKRLATSENSGQKALDGVVGGNTSSTPLVYRKFKVDYSKTNSEWLQQRQKQFYVPNVSFDTVPINGISGSYAPPGHSHSHSQQGKKPNVALDYTQEEYYDNETFDFSPAQSATGRAHDTKLDGLLKTFVIGKDGKIHRSDYPSRPCIKNSALVVTRSHKRYSAFWEQQAYREKTVAKQRMYREIVSRAAPKQKPTVSSAEEEERRRKQLIRQLKENGGDSNDAMLRKLAKINKQNAGFLPGPRCILVHISGRKQSWVTLDYVLKQVVNNGDHVVIVSNLPPLTPSQKRRLEMKIKARVLARANKNKKRNLLDKKHTHASRAGSFPEASASIHRNQSLRKTTRGRAAHIKDASGHSYYELPDGVMVSASEDEDGASNDDDDDDDVSSDDDEVESSDDDSDFDDEWSEGYSFENVKSALHDIIKYALVVLPEDKVVKISVDLSIGSLRKMFVNALNCYYPKLVFTSSSKFKANESLVVWKRKTLPDVLVNHFPVPVVVVPAKKLDYFEFDLLREIREKVERQQDEEQRNKESGAPVIKLAQTNKQEKKHTIRPPLPFMKSYTAEDLKKLNIKMSDVDSEDFDESDESRADNSSHVSSDMESIYSNTVTSSDEDSNDTETHGISDKVICKHDSRAGKPVQGQTPVCRLEHLLQHSKTQLDERLLKLSTVKNMTTNEKTSKIIDCILEESLSFNAKLEQIKHQGDGDETFSQLKRVITGNHGTTKRPSFSGQSKTTLEVSAAPPRLTKTKSYSTPSTTKRAFINSIPPPLPQSAAGSHKSLQRSVSPPPNNPSIRFAEAPKKPSTAHLKTSPDSSTQSFFSLKKMKSSDTSLDGGMELRKVKSSMGRLDSSRSTDSSMTSLSTQLSNSSTSSSTHKKKKSLFKALFGKKSDK